MSTFIKIENGIVVNAVSGPDIPCPEGYIPFDGDHMSIVGKSLEEPDPVPVKTPLASYIVERKHLYPKSGELLDMLWHGMHNDPSKRIEPFYGAILAIKTSVPASTADLIPFNEVEI